MNDSFKILNELSVLLVETSIIMHNTFENNYKYFFYQNGIRIDKKRRSRFVLHNVVEKCWINLKILEIYLKINIII